MSPDSVDYERARQLMMAALDGEISGEEQQELDRALSASADLREEWKRMHRVKEVTATMSYPEVPAEVWDDYWQSTYNKVERGIGWIFVSIGAVMLMTWGAWKWIETIWGDSGLPLFIRLSLLAVATGFFVLLVSVIRERLFARKRDPYKEVVR